MARPPDAPPPRRRGDGAGGQVVQGSDDTGNGSSPLRHGTSTCLGCDDLRARPGIAAEWLIWAAGYRRDARRAMWDRELAAAS